MAKNVLITGANRGIGLALTDLYSKLGFNTIAVCRAASEELKSLKNTEIIAGIDVTLDSDLEHLNSSLGDRNIDILINNAGILRNESFPHIDYSDVETQFLVNALAPLKVTTTLQKRLDSGAKVILITSRMGSLEDNTSGGYYGYRMSKAALNAAGVSLAQDLKNKNVSVALLHPGFVQTEMVQNQGNITAEESASALADRIEQLNIENSGRFWHSNGEILPW